MISTQHQVVEKRGPDVSVIVPVYQDQVGLERVLEALCRQDTEAFFEVVVVDNGSDPPIRTPVSASRQLSIQCINCHRVGAYAARNEGMKYAIAPVLAFLDADCQPAPTWITSGLKAMREFGSSSLVGGEVYLIPPERPTMVSRYQCAMGFRQKENIEKLGFGATANLWVPRGMVSDIGPFREDLRSGGDREWGLRALSKGYRTHYVEAVAVTTMPRMTLVSASRQARRVAGGAHQLRNEKLYELPIGLPESYEKPSLLNRFRIIWSLDEKGLDLVGVFFVAGVIWVVTQAEKLRLNLGANPERR